LDKSFGRGGSVQLRFDGASITNPHIAAGPHGRIVVVGVPRDAERGVKFVERLHYNGRPDASFGDGGITTVQTDPFGFFGKRALAVDGQGRITIAGSAGLKPALLRLTRAGAIDETFGENGIATPAQPQSIEGGDYRAVSVLPDGDLLAAGELTDQGSDTSTLVSRFGSGGSPVDGFGSGGSTVIASDPGTLQVDVAAVLSDPTGQELTVVSGEEVYYTRRCDISVIHRLDADGELDPEFGTDGSSVVLGFECTAMSDATLDTSGRVVMVGDEYRESTERFSIALARASLDGEISQGRSGRPAYERRLRLGGQDSGGSTLIASPQNGILIGGRQLRKSCAERAGSECSRAVVAKVDADGDLEREWGPVHHRRGWRRVN
jgi:uncharacterized delta-60 repeat protein